jgi:glycosyltransferase involved in cell wall biosynthesis
MKITYLYQYFGTPKGSWSTRVYELSRRWVQAGHQVTVITAPYEKSDTRAKGFVSEQWVDGIRLIVIDSGDDNRIAVWKRVWRAVLFAVVSTYFNLRIKADVVIASSGPITIGIPALIGNWFKRARFVFEVRDLWPDGGIEMGLIQGSFKISLSRWFERKCYRAAGLIITSSIGQKSHIASRFPNLSIQVIPHATDLELFKPKSRTPWPYTPNFKHVFLHIGSLGFIHNTQFIVEAARHIKASNRNDIGIVFIGEGSEREAMESLVKQYGLTDMVLFWGIRSKHEVAEALHYATATLFSTLNNPVQNTCSPNKLYDSFAAGIPVIQTTTGWISSLFEQYKCGINVSAVEPREMAEAMIQMSNNPDQTNHMGYSARILAEKEFNADRLAERYLKYIQALTL